MYESELETALYIAKQAAKMISDGFLSSFEIHKKDDGSLVTSIDKQVDTFIRETLTRYYPHHALLTEESKDDLSRIGKDFVWIIDPIDGTEEFVKHEYEFVLLMALAYKGEPVIGIIVEPIRNEIYYALKGKGAFRIKNGVTSKIHVSDKLLNLTCLTSPYHMVEEEKNYLDDNMNRFKEIKFVGAAYKACLIACGEADVSYRFSPYSKEWDTAAPQILIEEAGGVFFDKNRNKITYNKADVRNLDGFVILNRIENYF